MPSLHELQQGMMRALLDGETHPASLWLLGGENRLRIYRNNAESNFTDALRSSYPAIERLVGDDYFRQCARQFQRRYPSRSGDLQFAGEQFPTYLAQLHADDGYRYLGDIARLEWLIQETLLATDHEALNLVKLAAVEACDYPRLKFRLHPAARLFASLYPCLKIWEANANADEDAKTPDTIDLDSGADQLLLFRDNSRIQFYRLDSGEYEFLQALARGDTFESAVELATPFDAAAALQRFVAKRVIVDFH